MLPLPCMPALPLEAHHNVECYPVLTRSDTLNLPASRMLTQSQPLPLSPKGNQDVCGPATILQGEPVSLLCPTRTCILMSLAHRPFHHLQSKVSSLSVTLLHRWNLE